MSQSETDQTFSRLSQRSAQQAIGFLMQQGLENPDCLSLAAGFVDPVTLPVELVQDTATEILSSRAAGQKVLQYGSTAGSPELKCAFRDYLAKLDGDESHVGSVPLEQFILTTGSQQLLSLLSMVLFDEGDICLVAAPTYFVYLGVLDGVGAEVIPVDTDNNGMCPAALDRRLQELKNDGRLSRVRLVYVVSYHDNPSGISVSADRRPELLETVRRWSPDERPIYLLEDAAYRELHYDGDHLPSIWSYDEGYRTGAQQHVILSQTFSKSFSPGIRVGHGILPQELVKPVFDLKGNEDFGSTHLSQNILAEVLRSGRYWDHLETVKAGYRVKRDAMVAAAEEFFTDIPGVSWHSPRGGLYVWMTLPPEIETGFDSDLFRRATSVDKVMYVPGELCYPSGWSERPRNQMRLSYGVLDADGIREGMRRLSVALNAVMPERAVG